MVVKKTHKSIAELGKATRFKSGKRVVSIASKGGKANLNNPKTILSAKLRELKKKGMTDENAKKMYELMVDSNMSSLDIIKRLQDMVPEDNKEELAIVNQIINWHKMRHGSKESEKTITINKVITLTTEEREAEIERLIIIPK